MDFSEALIALKNNKKIIRKGWPENVYLSLKDKRILDESGNNFFAITANGLLADDWEIFSKESEQIIPLEKKEKLEYEITNSFRETKYCLIELKSMFMSHIVTGLNTFNDINQYIEFIQKKLEDKKTEILNLISKDNVL